MDNIDCLKVLTESIVKKQNDSLESLKKLSQATDIVSSDISNLINSLQMVGNRQFAENRVQEDEPLAQIGHIASGPQVNRNAAPMSAHDPDGSELSLRTILLRAIKLLPPEKGEEMMKEEEQGYEDTDERLVEDNDETKKESVQVQMSREMLGRSNGDKITRVDEKEDSCVNQTYRQDHEVASRSNDTRDEYISKKPCSKTLNRDRVADILKKYSLYDDDDDDEDDDDD